MNENESRALTYAAAATQLAASATLDALRLTNDPAARSLIHIFVSRASDKYHPG